MAVVRMTRKQLAKLTGQTAEPPKPPKPRQKARSVENAAKVVIPAIGQKWRLRKRLPRDNPPPVGTVCHLWQITERRLYLLGDGYSFDVSREQLGEFFEEVAW